ncbi:MAG TPA: AAA family ATPase [Candidatus Paceibacterota bacterium]|jgi:chromosome segregation protein|nr:AAA family ATPase [Candidatus Paceibacterota bacterium]
MRLKTLEINGFKSFAHKSVLEFGSAITCIVGPNGSGKSNVVEAFRYVLGEQSMKSMRGRSGTDLIFKGSKNLSKGSRATATVYFDNSDKVFKFTNDTGENVDLNYDTISISRQVFPDGLNKYILNNTDVRLKDIHNLLSSVNVGSSGHHIISQGEADRILNANARERREMVEDALGLKVYQYKIKESERKLERTGENMKEVGMLRRENAPHLNFLRKQVEKFEKAQVMQEELGALYRDYLKKESIYLDEEKKNLSAEKAKIESELKNINLKISDTADLGGESKKIGELRAIEQKLNEIRRIKGELDRKLGRIEGILESRISKEKLSGRCPMCGSIIEEQGAEQMEKIHNEEKELAELKDSQEQTVAEIKNLETEEKEKNELAEKFKTEINEEMEALRDKEREKFTHKIKQQELTSHLELLSVKQENLNREVEAFENEIQEGTALIGRGILDYKNVLIEGVPDRTVQEETRRKIERIKIKLEDAGLSGGAEIMKEFEEVFQRDAFLAKELEDLTKSIESLEKLIEDLKEKIDIEFKEGVKKINVEFEEFFRLMFGGGHAALSIVVENKRKKRDEDLELESGIDEEIVFEKGIEINVSLPHKKVKELQALSGGERSLTSIAILFAMSQVNPPPFLVLDETDAALDESNSRKYGDMLEKLSKHSQLVVVTHNRETMSRAGVLYGITVGSDGASKLLSVKFEEATQIAK